MDHSKIRQGTTAWFHMVGQLMTRTANEAGLPTSLSVSFVERYTDGSEVAGGLVQGIRFDIADGRPSFRVGAGHDETADVVVEIAADAARRLNILRTADQAYSAALQNYLEGGEMRVTGDPSRLGSWFEAVHDAIVERTG